MLRGYMRYECHSYTPIQYRTLNYTRTYTTDRLIL